MVEWDKVTDEVLQLAQQCIEKYRPSLMLARIGFLFRSEAQVSNGKVVLGQASKVPDKWKPLLEEPLDFVIWLASDYWFVMEPKEKRALMHHELCHCDILDGSPRIRPHDVEEFIEVVREHGLWYDSLRHMAQVAAPYQQQLPFTAPPNGTNGNGRVVALDPALGRVMA